MVADDRTGALETAGICADAGAGPVPVRTGAPGPVVTEGRVVVIDAGTRHHPPDEAAAMVTRVHGVEARHRAHKIDSTLRGNWAHELVATQRLLGGRVVVVAAFPALGRTCTDGVVSQHGVPVSEGHAGADARRPVWSSKPADHLRAAGATEVVELRGAEALGRWMDERTDGFAVCDAETDADLESLASVWKGGSDLLFAGTARSIGAVAGVLFAAGSGPGLRPPLPRPALVVCGSLHAAARRQVEVLVAEAGAVVGIVGEPGDDLQRTLANGGLVVLTTARPTVSPVGEDAATAAAEALAAAARTIMGTSPVGTLVVLGGDTAAAVLGHGALDVCGTVADGVPWTRDGDGRVIITRAGGFGHDRSLLELFSDRMDA